MDSEHRNRGQNTSKGSKRPEGADSCARAGWNPQHPTEPLRRPRPAVATPAVPAAGSGLTQRKPRSFRSATRTFSELLRRTYSPHFPSHRANAPAEGWRARAARGADATARPHAQPHGAAAPAGREESASTRQCLSHRHELRGPPPSPPAARSHEHWGQPTENPAVRDSHSARRTEAGARSLARSRPGRGREDARPRSTGSGIGDRLSPCPAV